MNRLNTNPQSLSETVREVTKGSFKGAGLQVERLGIDIPSPLPPSTEEGDNMVCSLRLSLQTIPSEKQDMSEDADPKSPLPWWKGNKGKGKKAHDFLLSLDEWTPLFERRRWGVK